MVLTLDTNFPIGIFDSGVGGLTVYRALHEHLPNERFIYLGDTARVGVIGPGARAAAALSKGKRIGVVATESTVQSGAYTRAIKKADANATVIERACPLFVPLAEEGWADNEVARTIAESYLADLRSKTDTLVLGCTHYPILRDVIQQTIGEEVELIDSGEATAAEVKTLLKEKGLARLTPPTGALERQLCDDLDHFYVTDAADRFARVAERFLGSKPSRLEAVEVWGDDQLRC